MSHVSEKKIRNAGLKTSRPASEKRPEEKRVLPSIDKGKMELTSPTNLKLKFSEPTSINIGDMKKITIRREDGKPLVIPTGKSFSYGVKKDTKYKSVSMSLVLHDVTIGVFESVISLCEKHLGKPPSYRRDDGTVTAYVKLKTVKGEILSKFYKDNEEIDPMTYEGKHCEVKAALAIEGMIISEKKVNLQVKIHEAMVREKVYEHVRLLDLEW